MDRAEQITKVRREQNIIVRQSRTHTGWIRKGSLRIARHGEADRDVIEARKDLTD